MAYVVNNLIRVGEYNAFAGASGTGSYGSAPSGTTIATGANLGIMYGPGYGSWGYNQTDISLTAVTTANLIRSAHWTNLRNILANIRTHQIGSVDALVPPSSSFSVAHLIQAHNSAAPTLNTYDIASVIETAAANRFAMFTPTLFSLITMTRASAWGAGAAAIVGTVAASWASADAAGWFFNTGGYLQLSFTQPVGSSQDYDWNDAFVTRIGSIRMKATSTSNSGTISAGSALGFYNLTSTFQTIWAAGAITNGFVNASYNTNTVRVEARVTGTAANGRPGSAVEFRVTATDAHIGVSLDSVDLGTTCTLSAIKDTTNLTNPPATPTGSIILNW